MAADRRLTLPEPARSSSNKILSLLLGPLPGSRGTTLRFVWLALSVSLSCCLRSSIAMSNVSCVSTSFGLQIHLSGLFLICVSRSGQISQVLSVLGCFSLHFWLACLWMSGNAPLGCLWYLSLHLGLPFAFLSVLVSVRIFLRFV